MSKKEAILESALKLLAENGVHNTPMSALAKNAGTGMGTIYNYFPNKEILINELYIKIKKEEGIAYKEFEEDQPIKKQFDSYFTSIIDFFTTRKAYFQFMEQLQASPIITEESRNKGMESANPVFDLLDKGKRDGIIKNIDSTELLIFIGGAIISYLRWYFDQSKTNEHSFTNQRKMIWDAIKE